MHEIKARRVLKLHSGLIGLTDDQARRRLHNLETADEEVELPEDRSLFRILNPVEFKVDEVLFVDKVNKVDNPLVMVDLGEDTEGADVTNSPDDETGGGDDPDAEPSEPDAPNEDDQLDDDEPEAPESAADEKADAGGPRRSKKKAKKKTASR